MPKPAVEVTKIPLPYGTGLTNEELELRNYLATHNAKGSRLGRPRLPPEKRRQGVNFTLSPQAYQPLKAFTDKHQCTIGQAVELLVLHCLPDLPARVAKAREKDWLRD